MGDQGSDTYSESQRTWRLVKPVVSRHYWRLPALVVQIKYATA